MLRHISLLFSLAIAASAALSPRQAPAASNKKLLIGAPGQILAADFDGTNFKIVANVSEAGTGPSWLLFKEPDILYAVNENSNNTRRFKFDPATNTLQKQKDFIGSSGVVFLEFNRDKTRMVGAAFGAGAIDVWDVAPTTGDLTLRKTIKSTGALGPTPARQTAPHPHQALLDPTGRFFVVNDLGTDSLLVIDSADDRFDVTNMVRVAPAGCGPRHGAFFPAGLVNAPASHYIVVCEILSLVQVFELNYTPDTITFTSIQTISTFGADFPPLNATSASAGELVLSADSEHVYISNRLTGNDTDSIAHFRVSGILSARPGGGVTGPVSLSFEDTFSTRGAVPRMFSLSGPANANFPPEAQLNLVAAAAQQDVVFVANQQGELALLALSRDRDSGTVAAAAEAAPNAAVNPLASVVSAAFGATGFGPQFVMQVPVPQGAGSAANVTAPVRRSTRPGSPSRRRRR